MITLALDDLGALFTGVPDDNNEWATTPCYRVPLAYEIAKRCDSQTEFALRTILYDDTPCDHIPPRALEAIKLAAERYRLHRQVNNGGRGL